MKQLAKVFFLSSIGLTLLFSGSYECHFTKKISYSSKRDRTPNKIRRVSMWVIYRVVGDELLTRPDGVNRTYTAYSSGKFLGRDGTLYYGYTSRTGYVYAISEDMSQVMEMTPSGKTVLTGYCNRLR